MHCCLTRACERAPAEYLCRASLCRIVYGCMPSQDEAKWPEEEDAYKLSWSDDLTACPLACAAGLQRSDLAMQECDCIVAAHAQHGWGHQRTDKEWLPARTGHCSKLQPDGPLRSLINITAVPSCLFSRTTRGEARSKCSITNVLKATSFQILQS